MRAWTASRRASASWPTWKRPGLLVKIADHTHAVGTCDRCGTIIEPRASTQWFVKMKPLAEPAIAAVERGEIEIVPENRRTEYFEWMRNIRDWCISRQLWWGHRIPGMVLRRLQGDHRRRAKAPDEVHANAVRRKLTQDPDVLETWFSSALWPFSTMGWPDDTPDFRKYYPTSLLITGYDILFFWVARMIMMGLKFTGQGSLPASLPALAGAQCGRAENVQVQGHGHRSRSS